jgi:hypothetical protein
MVRIPTPTGISEAKGWRAPAPAWLRIIAGVLVCPLIWLVFALLGDATLRPLIFASVITQVLLFIASAVISWTIVRTASVGRACVLSILPSVALLITGGLYWYSQMVAERMRAEAIRNPERAEQQSARGEWTLPDFPWPPPFASASYVLPDDLFQSYHSFGDALSAILSALETTGYEERSFFRTEPDGVALVTRLERINEDGSSIPQPNRWLNWTMKGDDLIAMLRGLFFVDPGHYRVIVFVLQDKPFSQSSQKPVGSLVEAWLRTGANVLPPEIRDRPLGQAHCTVLIYEFASESDAAHVVVSRLTGKQHLEKSGILSLLQSRT